MQSAATQASYHVHAERSRHARTPEPAELYESWQRQSMPSAVAPRSTSATRGPAREVLVRTGRGVLEQGVRRPAEAAGLGPGAGQHVGHAAARAALELQVVVVSGQVQLHAVPLQQRLHVLCAGSGFP